MRRGRFQLFWLIGFALVLNSGCGDAAELNLHDANFDAGFDGIAAVCGDGLLEGEEECDDGNTEPGDGCSPDCRLERPSCASDADCEDENECREEARCDLTILQCVAGDARVGAACDGAVCDSGVCEPGVCDPAGECVPTGCGNGILESGEQCDDWNLENGDGCSSRCRIETAFRVQQIELVDPHFHSFAHLSGSLREAVGGCQDFTNVERELTLPLGMTPIAIPAVNDLLGGALSPGEDGAIALSVLIVVDSIGEPGAEHPFSVHGASCERVDGGCTGPELLTDTSYEDGRCFDLMPETASESWSEALNEPSIACFESAETTVLLEFTGISFRLEHASFAGEWRETPLGIERGVLRGFLKESDADEVNLLDALDVANVAGVLSLSTFLPGGKTSVVDALLGPIRLPVSFGSCFTPHDGPPHYGKDVYEDEPGWWFYMNYTAGSLSD